MCLDTDHALLHLGPMHMHLCVWRKMGLLSWAPPAWSVEVAGSH